MKMKYFDSLKFDWKHWIIYSTVCDNAIDEKLKCENVLIICALALSVEYSIRKKNTNYYV